MATRQEIADQLTALADVEFERQRQQVLKLPEGSHTVLLIEGSRLVDFHHVLHFMSKTPELALSDFDFDVMVRGWNAFAALLLPHVGNLKGIPAVESTPAFRNSVLSILMDLGKVTILRENAAMYRHGMAECTIDGTTISFRMSDRCSLDHFLDRLEEDKLRRLENTMPSEDLFGKIIQQTSIDDIEDRIRSLVFPWRLTEKLTMTGYNADPDIDQHYFALVAEGTHKGIEYAGIHDDTILGSITGKDLKTVVFLLTSFYLKHIRFVDVAKKAFPEINIAMSLTIWKPRNELVQSITDITGMTESTVSTAVDLLTVKSGHETYFRAEVTPYFPMLLKVSDNYLLEPIASIFRNPFHGIRMMHEAADKKAAVHLLAHRERWMASELYNLFQGTRYQRMEGTTNLRQGGKIITDIDAAIYDVTTGALGLFQLKWQDFNSNNVAKQRSKAKNYVEQVDAWGRSVQEWLAEFGPESFLRTLRMKGSHGISQVHLFALGRSAARFQSYGYTSQIDAIASASWRQFIRLRYEVGPSENVLSDLHLAIQSEKTTVINLRPIRQQMQLGEHIVVFENLWNEFVDNKEASEQAP